MNATSDLERSVRMVLESSAPSAPPDELLARVLTTTRGGRPRPAWLADLKEPPMRHTSRVTVGSPTLRVAAIMALTLALALAAAGAVIAGASLMPSEPVAVLPPFGPAANGNLLYAKDGDLYLADADGSNSRAITTTKQNESSPQFSHDGQTITFAAGPDTNPAAMLADADGSKERTVLEAQEWSLGFMADDERLIATRGVGDSTVLSVVDVAAGSIKDLDLGDVEPWYFQEPRPNSDEIVFMGHTTPGGPERGLFAIRPDDTGLRTIGATTGDVPDADTAFQDIDLSPDGKTIAYWSWEPKGGVPGATAEAYLHLRDLDTGEELPVLFDHLGSDNPYGDDNGLIPRFSPDGTMMIYEWGVGTSSHVFYGPLDGSTPAREVGPEWSYTMRHGFEFSPDGTKVIVFLSNKSVLIDLATNTWTDLDIAGDWVSWQRLAQS
jgi:dipeptidyl aminopeptidase/acylaminoacyl peptidase